MDRFVIESPHNADDCRLVITQIHAMGYLHHFEWGCPDGVHSGWAFIEAEDENQARMIVPSVVRNSARVVRISRYNSNELGEIHLAKN